MSRFSELVILVVSVAACDQGGAGAAGGGGSAGSAVAATPVQNPGGGFSADLSKKLDKAGSGTDTPARTNNSMAAETAPAPPPVDTGSGSAGTKPDDTKVAAVKPADVKPADVKPADVKPADVKPADVKPADVKPADTQPTSISTAPKINGKVVISNGTTPKPVVLVPAELKAMNISLLPNWDRDVEAAGTISLAVKIPPNKTETATFIFHYGVEDPKAPADRDAYKKWLADNKIFVSKDDRQKGSAWYLEGVDPQNGKTAFRMVIVYGGKKLICYGPLYKDSSLGDLRDQTIIQAKQICETLTL